MSTLAFCPVPHTRRDQIWLGIGLSLGLGLTRLLRRLLSSSSSSTSAPVLQSGNVKLYYWPATGRAEIVRMLLAEAGVAFEDVTFEKPAGLQVHRDLESFMAVKASAAAQKFFVECRAKGGNSTNNTPMLEIGGHFYTQSTALYRLAARLSGLYPQDSEAAYVVDNVLAHCEDMFPLCYNALFGRGLTKDELANDMAPLHLGNLERLLGLHGGDWFTGSFSVADVRVVDVCVHLFSRSLPGCLVPFPRLTSLVERVVARPKIAAYLASEQYKKTDKFFPL